MSSAALAPGPGTAYIPVGDRPLKPMKMSGIGVTVLGRRAGSSSALLTGASCLSRHWSQMNEHSGQVSESDRGFHMPLLLLWWSKF